MIKKEGYIFSLVSMLLVVALITVSLMTFISTVNKYEQESNNRRMSEVARKNNDIVNSLFRGAYTTLDVIRVVFENKEDSISNEELSILDQVSKEGYFDHLIIQLPDGKYYGGNSVDKYNSYFDIAKNMDENKMYISDFIAIEETNEYQVDMALPIRDEKGETKAVLQGTINIEKILNKLIKDEFHEEGYYHLIDTNGRYISFPKESKAFHLNKNYFTTTNKLDYGSGSSAKKMKEDMKNGRAGSTHYSYKGDERYAYYEPVGINNWFMSTVIPANIVNNQSKKITYLGSEIIIMLIIIVTIIYAIAIQLISRSTKIAQKQKEKVRLIEIEHERTLREISYSLFDNILEADMTTNKLLGDTSTTLITLLGLKGDFTYSDCIDAIVEKLVREDFKDKYRRKMARESIINAFNLGKQVITFECVERSGGVNYEWIRITVRIYRCHNTGTIRIISYVKNIEKEKRKELALRNKAERDSFTKLYNKIATEKKINKMIEDKKENNHAFVIIDIDNFKTINDTLGHVFGDEIILKCSDAMNNIFNESEIKGRIGGDEFVVFIPNYESISEIESKVDRLRNRLCKDYKEGNERMTVSISVGISLYPQHGKTFENLYNKSDEALYYSKKKGRNTISFYLNEDYCV